MAVTLMDKVIYGLPSISILRFNRDNAKTQYEANQEAVMFDILKNNKRCRDNNYEAVREWYRQVYNINLPSLDGCEEQYGTVERWIRLLKSLYPHDLTDEGERAIKAEKEAEFRENALDRNKPIKTHEQTSLLVGETLKEWW